MYIDFEPGDYVLNPANKKWGVGQIQSMIGNKVTVNLGTTCSPSNSLHSAVIFLR